MLCSQLIIHVNLIHHTTSGYPLAFHVSIFINICTHDLISMNLHLCYTFVLRLMFTFIHNLMYIPCMLQIYCTMLLLCKNNDISLTLNYVLKLFHQNIMYFHTTVYAAFNRMVMSIFRHFIKYIEGRLKCTIVKHAKYYITSLIDDDIVIVSQINYTINFIITAIVLCLYFYDICTIVLLSPYTISLYAYYICNIIKLLCLLLHCLCAMKHDTINELFIVSYTIIIEWNAVIYSWYLISKKFNFMNLFVNIIRNFSVLHLLYSILSSISQKPIKYPCVSKLISLPVANLNKVKFKVIILPISDTFLNGYTDSVWLFRVTWLYVMTWPSVQIMILNIFLYICIYCIVCYNMCSLLLSLKLGNNARTQCKFKRTVQIVVDKKAYCIFSWSISICFIYIAPTYHRARYLFRLLIYG